MKNGQSKYSRIRDILLTLLFLSLATAVCVAIRIVDKSDIVVPMIFILAVFLISRYTCGYVYGVVASVIAVICVNYAFTYPYFAFDFSVSGYPITFLCMLCVAITTSTMTTKIKEQEHLRAKSEKEITKTNLLRAISHDLRTPLTTIIGSACAILDNQDTLSTEKKSELLHEIIDDADWLIRMVENFLSITRMGDADAKIEKTDEAIEEVVGESVHKFKKRISTVEICVCVPHFPLFVPMDAVLIEQVILNLLDNAVSHGKTTTKIFVSVECDTSNAIISVTDDGCGIPSDVMPHIFEGNLIHSSQSSADNKKDMGIGLSVCKSIIMAHGGNIGAENNSDSGAKFIFTLPLTKDGK